MVDKLIFHEKQEVRDIINDHVEQYGRAIQELTGFVDRSIRQLRVEGKVSAQCYIDVYNTSEDVYVGEAEVESSTVSSQAQMSTAVDEPGQETEIERKTLTFQQRQDIRILLNKALKKANSKLIDNPKQRRKLLLGDKLNALGLSSTRERRIVFKRWYTAGFMKSVYSANNCTRNQGHRHTSRKEIIDAINACGERDVYALKKIYRYAFGAEAENLSTDGNQDDVVCDICKEV